MLADGKPVTQLSYVVLKVTCLPAIRDHLTGPTPWRNKLNAARQAAQDYVDDDFAKGDDQTRRAQWEQNCLVPLREARTLLQADPNFLPSEAELAYRLAFRECQDLIASKARRYTEGAAPEWAPDPNMDRAFLDLPPGDESEASLDKYSEQLFAARSKLDALPAC